MALWIIPESQSSKGEDTSEVDNIQNSGTQAEIGGGIGCQKCQVILQMAIQTKKLAGYFYVCLKFLKSQSKQIPSKIINGQLSYLSPN